MTRRFRTRLLAAFASLAAVWLALPGCDSGQSGGNTILIGHYASMTGAESTFGQSTDAGVRLAIKQINAAGGVKGKKLELITYDTKGEAKEAGVAVTRLVTRDRVVAVLGEVASKISLAGAPVCQQYGVPMITPSSTNPKVTEVGDMIFRVCFIDPFQGYACAKFAREQAEPKAEKVAVLYDQAAPYSVGLKDVFVEAFEKMGGKITTIQTYTAGDQEFSAQLTTIRGTEPDMIFVPGYYTDVGNIAVQARKLNITAPFLGGDGWESPMLTKIGGEAIEGSYYSNHYSHADPSERIQTFIADYRAAYNATPDSLAALGYDAVHILRAAIERSPSLSGKDLAAAIAATKEAKCVTGVITLNAQRNAVKPAVILKVEGGTTKYCATVEPPK